MTLRKAIHGAVGVLAAAAVSGGALVGAAPAVSAEPITIMGACGTTQNPSVPGGKAYWEVQCDGKRVRIDGWVEDTRADGKCAKVKAEYAGDYWWYSTAACPKGNRDYFTSPYRTGKSVAAWLYTYNV